MVESEALASFLPAPFRNQIAAATPLRRTARPEDIARVIAFFADDDSGFMTGTCAPVTGGFGLARGNFASSLNGWSPGAKRQAHEHKHS
jgi:3-oxoacyl-[acyl-carrier protein] reductase